jgi:hypothetical protein
MCFSAIEFQLQMSNANIGTRFHLGSYQLKREALKVFHITIFLSFEYYLFDQLFIEEFTCTIVGSRRSIRYHVVITIKKVVFLKLFIINSTATCVLAISFLSLLSCTL